MKSTTIRRAIFHRLCRLRGTTVAATLTVTAFCFGAQAAETRYAVTAIPLIDGTYNGVATSINARGEVVGYDFTQPDAFTDRAFIWSPITGLRQLDPAIRTDYLSYAFGINDAGQVVGWYGGHGFAWSQRSGLNTLPGDYAPSPSNAYAINNAGEMAGWSVVAGRAQATLWRPDGSRQILDPLAGIDQRFSEAYAINDAGLAVGGAFIPNSDGSGNGGMHAFLWDANRGMVDLGTLSASSQQSFALGVNDRGQVVGWSLADNSNQYRAFLWSEGQGMVDLGSYVKNDSRDLVAYDINNVGQIVGGIKGTSGNQGFIWTNRGGLESLDDLLDDAAKSAGWHVVSATSINDAGEIAAVVESALGQRAAVLSPVPEPGTFALMLLGLAGVGTASIRRVNKPS